MMTSPSEKLAASLIELRKLQTSGVIAIRASDLSRTHRTRLLKMGFLKEIIKGWYIPSRPDEHEGESTAWYVSFWHFCAAYLNKRFKQNWCLSPEQSLSLHSGNWTIPPQLLVRAPKGSNKILHLPFHTSLFDVRNAMPDENDVEILNGLRVYSLPSALIAASPRFFSQHTVDAKTALSLIQDASIILRPLLAHSHSQIAGRLAGAFRHIGRIEIADRITRVMRGVDFDIREINPFDESSKPVIFSARERSPYVNRMQILWEKMREPIIKHFPKPPKKISSAAYLKHVKEIYVTDAYHSLSIEGYLVSNELLERVRSGKWAPESNEVDREHIGALAARGYWLAFNAVEKSLHKILKGENAGNVFSKDHHEWFYGLFSPSITAGILKPADLAGYRNHQVYIRRSMHVPPNPEAVRDLMPAFYELLSNEPEASVRVVLGHFFFVYIHPYMDGNGRISRFLMNSMLASGGYPWLVIPVEKRTPYFAALEKASTQQDIVPFCKFLAGLIEK